jgi:hypothetical protein
MNDFVAQFGFGGRKCPGNRLAHALFSALIEHLQKSWAFVAVNRRPAEIDKTKAFRTPKMDVWTVPAYWNPSLDKRYYDCSPYLEKNRNGFVAISVSSRSPFLADASQADRIVTHIASMSNRYVILICDEIAQFNIQAFDLKPPIVARIKARRLGTQLADIFKSAVTASKASNIRVVQWNELLLPDVSKLSVYKILDERIRRVAENFIQSRGQGKINTSHDNKLELVCRYIYSEIPVLIHGVWFQGVSYPLLYYPGHSSHFEKFADDNNSLHRLALDIAVGQEFEEVREALGEMMDRRPCKIPGFIGLELHQSKTVK